MNVLLPTDFSDNALLAAEFAFAIAEASQGKVTVLHAYDLPYADRSMTTSLLDVMKQNAESNMEEYREKLKDYKAPFETSVVLGNPIRLIKEMSQEASIDIVVMGTKGASGLEEILIGSNAASVVQNSQKPVLIVPPDAHWQKPEKMIFANDFSLKGQEEALRELRQFADLFDTKIDVVHVQREGGSDTGSRDLLAQELGERIVEFTVLRKDNIEDAITQEADKENAQMISAISKKYGFFERLFRRSITAKLAYHTHIPLLVLHEPK